MTESKDTQESYTMRLTITRRPDGGTQCRTTIPKQIMDRVSDGDKVWGTFTVVDGRICFYPDPEHVSEEVTVE